MEKKKLRTPAKVTPLTPEPDLSKAPTILEMAPDRRAPKRIPPFGLLLLFGIALVIIVATLMISRPAEPEVPVIPEFTPGETSLAVLCFRNDSGDADMDIWEKGLAQALTLDLLQSPSLKVVEGSRLFHALLPLKLSEKRRRKYTQSDLRRMAGVSGASVFMTGSITRSGKGFKLHTVLKEASGNSLFSESFDCSGEDEMLSRVDDLADWVRANLPVSREDTAPERNRDVQDITTDTAEPFKDYVRGKWHFWRKDYSQAIAAFISSLEYDPEFALGHMELAAAYKASGYPDRARKQLQTAQGLIDQLSERDRYHLQGEFYRLSEKTYDIALKVYLRLLELYPDDPRANTHLGMLYTQLNRWEEAAERFQVNIKNRVIEPDSYLGYATNYIQQGMFSEAENVLLGYFNRHQDNADIRLHLAWLHLLQRDYNAALSELEKGLSLNPSCYLHLLKGDLQMLRGDLIAAQAEYTRLQQMEDPLSHLWGRQRMADLHLLKGKFQQAREQLHAGLQEAVSQDELGWKYRFHLDLARFFLDSGNPVQTLRQCEQAWEIAVPGDTAVFPREVLHLQGLAYLALNRRSDLNKTVLRLKSLCQKGPVLDRMRYFYHLKGEIEMAGGNYTQAITYFGQAFNHLPPQGKPWEPGNDHALFIDSLSDALYAGGKPSEALEKLEELRALSAGRLAYGDLYARCFYKLGKIREENGMRDIATEFYHRFLALWEDADPGIPELSDARQRIAASQGR